jgi:hypothetical protein
MDFESLLAQGVNPPKAVEGLTDYDEWHYYDGPLIGVFRVKRQWVFWATIDGLGEKQRWVYIPVSEATKNDLWSTLNNEQYFSVALARIVRGLPAVIALEVAGSGLVEWESKIINGDAVEIIRRTYPFPDDPELDVEPPKE